MTYLIDEIYGFSNEDKKNATSKAREDIVNISKTINFCILKKEITPQKNNSKFGRLLFDMRSLMEWRKFFITNKFCYGDIVCIQYPMINYPFGFSCVLKLMRKKRIKTIAIIHDLNCVRYPQFHLFRKKEIITLNSFDCLINHNNKMNIKLTEFGINRPKIVDLQIFDYLSSCADKRSNKCNVDVAIAGNLSKLKSGYLYSLPKDVSFSLYGLNYEGNEENVLYYGAFSPDALPSIICGKFGLVWDGPSAFTCEGNYGEYLKINNPHKLSLYMAAGIPVIVWKKAAIAEFVKEQNIGILIDSLFELKNILDRVTDKEYEIMKKNAENIKVKVSEGYYIKMALNKAMKLLDE